MYYCNVIVKDKDESPFRNELVFHFKTYQEGLEFAKQIIEISEYDIEILQFFDGEDENGEIQANRN